MRVDPSRDGQQRRERAVGRMSGPRTPARRSNGQETRDPTGLVAAMAAFVDKPWPVSGSRAMSVEP